MTPRAVLVGMPGAGKTTTGRRLAAVLGVAFADSDDLVTAATGRTVAELFAEQGEDGFRRAEAAAVVAALARFDGVLALGGGALTSASVRDALRGSGVPVVLLRASLATLGRRVGAAVDRPLLAGDPARRLERLARERAQGYEEAATLRVDTEGRTQDEVASSIAAALHATGVT